MEVEVDELGHGGCIDFTVRVIVSGRWLVTSGGVMHRQWISSGQKLKPQRNTKVHKAYVIQEEALTTEDTGDTEAQREPSVFAFWLWTWARVWQVSSLGQAS